MKAVLYMKLKMSKRLLLRVSTLAGPGAEVGGQIIQHFPNDNIFLVFCPYDANKVQVASEECECSERDSLRCQQGETCVKPSGDTGVEVTGSGGTDDVSSNTNDGISKTDPGSSGSVSECKVPCRNPAWDEANNVESPGNMDQEYLLGEHTFTCTENHYVMTQKVYEDT